MAEWRLWNESADDIYSEAMELLALVVEHLDPDSVTIGELSDYQPGANKTEHYDTGRYNSDHLTELARHGLMVEVSSRVWRVTGAGMRVALGYETVAGLVEARMMEVGL